MKHLLIWQTTQFKPIGCLKKTSQIYLNTFQNAIYFFVTKNKKNESKFTFNFIKSNLHRVLFHTYDIRLKINKLTFSFYWVTTMRNYWIESVLKIFPKKWSKKYSFTNDIECFWLCEIHICFNFRLSFFLRILVLKY